MLEHLFIYLFIVKISTFVSGAVNNLLETLSDKDEGFREAIEKSLVRMCKRRPNETIEIICNYRLKTQKLPDPQIAVLLR